MEVIPSYASVKAFLDRRVEGHRRIQPAYEVLKSVLDPYLDRNGSAGKKPTREEIRAYLDRYFDAYNRYSQVPETADRMDEFWGPDFKVTGRFFRKTGTWPLRTETGEEFKQLILKSHEVVGEKLTPTEVLIDTEKMMAGVRLHIDKTHRKTGENVVFVGVALYGIGVTESGALILKSLDMCVDNPERLMGMSKYK
jgi:hypothetical protein